jgi:YD repeat-containing protein
VTASVDPLGNRTSYAYDNVGNQTSVTNPLGFITTSVYSANSNRMSASVDPLGNRTTYSYDLAGQQTSRQDARGNRTSYACDSVIAHHHAIITSYRRGEINSVNFALRSNAEYGDARGGSYSVGEGQLTNGNYGEYELPGFPRDWNPLKRGEMPRITPMPPYKKPPRKNPPPVEIIPPPRKDPPIPGPVPPKRELLPGNGDDRANAARLRLVTCLGCCTWQAVGSGPIGNAIRIDLWLPEVSCTESDRFDLEPMPWPKFFPWKESGVLEQTCLEEGWPPEFCKGLTPERAPDNIGKLPDEVKDSLKKLDKFRSACEKLTCFGECWLEYEEGLVRAGNPVPWQLCGLEDDAYECQNCCAAQPIPGNLILLCQTQCLSHY